MNKQHILSLKVIPDGQAPWLSYDHYLELKRLFESVALPSSDSHVVDSQYMQLYHFLTQIAGLQVPMNEAAIHFNTFALIRRGYQLNPKLA